MSLRKARILVQITGELFTKMITTGNFTQPFKCVEGLPKDAVLIDAYFVPEPFAALQLIYETDSEPAGSSFHFNPTFESYSPEGYEALLVEEAKLRG